MTDETEVRRGVAEDEDDVVQCPEQAPWTSICTDAVLFTEVTLWMVDKKKERFQEQRVTAPKKKKKRNFKTKKHLGSRSHPWTLLAAAGRAAITLDLALRCWACGGWAEW